MIRLTIATAMLALAATSVIAAEEEKPEPHFAGPHRFLLSQASTPVPKQLLFFLPG